MPLFSSFFLTHPFIFTLAMTGLGLLVGSFLNVVIYRLPLIMEREWKKECRDYLELEADKSADEEKFNLSFPLSHCPQCKQAIKPYQNIPVFSYVFLRGQCASCHTHIALRYPLVEVLTGACSAIVTFHFGYSVALIFALLLTWCLIVLSFIDFDVQLLPDSLTLPMLWLGLLLSLFDVFTDTHSSLLGAMVGYLSLWLVYQLFKLTTDKEGMGYGDFKLLGLFGAWLGWQYLPVIVLLSSFVGAIIGVLMIIFFRHNLHKPIPFGPYLAAAGWLALIWGEKINQMYLTTAGLQ